MTKSARANLALDSRRDYIESKYFTLAAASSALLEIKETVNQSLYIYNSLLEADDIEITISIK
jgi:hypothetical protein